MKKTPKQLPPVEQLAIDALIEYSFNSKVHTQEQIHRIAESIVRFGWIQPIAVDSDNIILAGHGRLEAAKLLKLAKVPVVKILNLTEAEKITVRIADNKVAADTSYDYGNLEMEVLKLEQLEYDATPFHFEEFKFSPEPEEEKEKEPEAGTTWIGQIKLRVPADIIDSFESRLDDLVREFDGVTKETKRMK